jgi:hypothetical protein
VRSRRSDAVSREVERLVIQMLTDPSHPTMREVRASTGLSLATLHRIMTQAGYTAEKVTIWRRDV